MKYADIQKLHDAGLITGQQRQKIIEHFNLKEDGGNKFLAILSMIGAALITTGIILLISAHWNEIPRGAKIAGGMALMLGFHAGGWWLREVRGKYRRTGEALHLVGSGLFLANLALLGQIYNIVSRPPNAFLAWWIGIAALPWLLRSKAQHVLLLIAFGIWFGLEVNERGSWIYCGDDARQLLLYALLGLAYLGAGWVLRRGAFADFAGVTEKLGLLVFLTFFYPLTWKDFFGGWENPETRPWFFPVLGLVALASLVTGVKNLRALTAQWRWTWFAALAGMMVFMASVWLGLWRLDHPAGSRFYWGDSWSYLGGTLALFIFCLLQVQVGLQERSAFLVNLGVVFIALDIIAAYLDLFGSMARTGVMFLVSGVFLIVFGVYLERKRRKLMKQIQSSTAMEAP
ncbi:MAG: DUF2157 domain-containing protein [Verrucomicrobiota bacterium]|nr:DUF2157 domain-containing protein [Verrucomicrobiota bacterium]